MQTVGPYTLLGSLGRCDVGGVWSAVDAAGRRFTVAILDAAAANDQGWRDAFAATAYALSQAPADGVALVHADYTAPAPWVARADDGGPGAAQVFLALGLQVRPVSTAPVPVPDEEPTVVASTAHPAPQPEADDELTAPTVVQRPVPQPEADDDELTAPTIVQRPVQPSPVSGEATQPTAVNPDATAEAAQEAPTQPHPVPVEPGHPTPDPGHPAPDPGYPAPDPLRAARPWDPPQAPVSGAPHTPVSRAPHTPGAPYAPVSGAPHTPVSAAPYAPVSGAPHIPVADPPHAPPRAPVFGPHDVPVSGVPQPISAMPTSPFGYFPAEPTSRKGPGPWLIVAVGLLALVLGAGGAVIVTSLGSEGDSPTQQESTPPAGPTDIGLPTVPPSQPGLEPPDGGGWPTRWPKFGSADQTETINNLEGIGFSFQAPRGWDCLQTARTDGYVKYSCGIGTEIGGDLIVRHCQPLCTADRRTELRRAEEAFGRRWTRSGQFATWADTTEINGEPRYGLVYVGYWRSVPENEINRQLVFRMTAPPDRADELRKVVNSIRDETFTL